MSQARPTARALRMRLPRSGRSRRTDATARAAAPLAPPPPSTSVLNARLGLLRRRPELALELGARRCKLRAHTLGVGQRRFDARRPREQASQARLYAGRRRIDELGERDAKSLGEELRRPQAR